jgi:hypothetical protein
MFGFDDILSASIGKYLIPLAGDAIGSLFSDSDDKATAKAITTSVASAAVQTAAKLTGVTITDEATAQQAATALQADPAKLADYQRAVNEQAVAVMAEETKRLQIVNETMRAEASSGDPFVRRMRPSWGYAMAFTWFAQMMAASYTIVTQPQRAADVLNGIASTTALWGLGLAVLGVYVNGRTQEKGAAGMQIPFLAKKR